MLSLPIVLWTFPDHKVTAEAVRIVYLPIFRISEDGIWTNTKRVVRISLQWPETTTDAELLPSGYLALDGFQAREPILGLPLSKDMEEGTWTATDAAINLIPQRFGDMVLSRSLSSAGRALCESSGITTPSKDAFNDLLPPPLPVTATKKPTSGSSGTSSNFLVSNNTIRSSADAEGNNHTNVIQTHTKDG